MSPNGPTMLPTAARSPDMPDMCPSGSKYPNRMPQQLAKVYLQPSASISKLDTSDQSTNENASRDPKRFNIQPLSMLATSQLPTPSPIKALVPACGTMPIKVGIRPR